MRNKLFIIVLVVGFLGVAILEGLPTRFGQWVGEEKGWRDLLKSVPIPESLPGPLRGPLDSSDVNLTVSGVIEHTNKQRELYNQVPLHSNKKLTLAAEAKLEDMFKQQYFEHESPDGKRPADVIKAAGYEYIVVGENLALGNYENDQILVEAWMNSPGHRANILDGKFDEIGVAVGKGMFEGKEIWLAVQEFGAPLSICPSSGQSLKYQIEDNKDAIGRLENELSAEKKKIDGNNYPSREAYDRAVDSYNTKANKLNSLVDQTRDLVDMYNKTVTEFNKCLEMNA